MTNLNKVGSSNLEPGIYRQRLILEGHFSREIQEEDIKFFLQELSKLLEMRVFAGPFAWPPDPWTNQEVELYELNGFVAWTESGCHVYAWRPQKFFSCDIYSCKPFSVERVVNYCKSFFKSDNTVYLEI